MDNSAQKIYESIPSGSGLPARGIAHRIGFRLRNDQRHPVVRTLLALGGDSSVYLFGAALIGAGNFVLVPLYTRYLSPANFGVYTLVDLALFIAVTVSTLRLDVAYLKWFGGTQNEKPCELLGSVLTCSAICGLSLGLILAASLGSAAAERWLRAPDYRFVWLLIPLVLLENVQVILLANLRAYRRALSYSLCAAFRLLLIILASLHFVVAARQGVTGIFLGRLVGDAGSMIVLLVLSAPSLRPRLQLPMLKKMLFFSLPLIWTGFAAVLMDAEGRYFLTRYRSMEEVGVYGAGVKIGSVFQVLVTQPFGMAWGGMVFQIANGENARSIYSRILAYVFFGSLVAALLLSTLAPEFLRLFATKAYAPALGILPLIFLVRAIAVLEYPASTGIYLSGHTSWFAGIYSAGLAITFVFCWLLVPRWGMYGVVWSWGAGWAAIAALMFLIGQKYYALRLDVKFFAVPVLCWAVLLAGQHGAIGALAQFSRPTKIVLCLGIVLYGLTMYLRDLRSIGKEAPGE